MSWWLVKQEPETYSFDQFQSDKKTEWTGVRNFQARNNLKLMKKGDSVFYYHSGKERCIIGLAEVTKSFYPDPTAEKEEGWVCVELTAKKRLSSPITLEQMKKNSKLSSMILIRQSRLSVMPVTDQEKEILLDMQHQFKDATA